MNYRMTSFILGRMLGVEALVMVIPAIVSAIYGEETMRAFLITSAVLMVLFLIFGRKKPENAMIYAKEGFVIVGAGMDSMVRIRSTSVLYFGNDAEIYRCTV